MAFVKKVWKNRVSEFFNRYRLENVSTGQVTNAYINLNDGAVEEEGDKINAETLNDLEDRINSGFNSVLDNSAIANNLTTTVQGKVLDARQGKVLKELIDSAGGGSEDMIAGVEATSISSQAYTIGQYLIYNKLLYKVTSAIALGDTLTVGTNIAQKKIAEEVADHLVVNGTEFYFDTHDNEFGYNTSPNRGADTFHPFKKGAGQYQYSFDVGSSYVNCISMIDGSYRRISIPGSITMDGNTFSFTRSGTSTIITAPGAGWKIYDSGTIKETTSGDLSKTLSLSLGDNYFCNCLVGQAVSPTFTADFDFAINSNWTNDYATFYDLNAYTEWHSTGGSITLSGVTFTYTNGTTFKIDRDATIYTASGPVGSINALAVSDYTANSNITRVKNQLYLIKLK